MRVRSLRVRSLREASSRIIIPCHDSRDQVGLVATDLELHVLAYILQGLLAALGEDSGHGAKRTRAFSGDGIGANQIDHIRHRVRSGRQGRCHLLVHVIPPIRAVEVDLGVDDLRVRQLEGNREGIHVRRWRPRCCRPRCCRRARHRGSRPQEDTRRVGVVERLERIPTTRDLGALAVVVVDAHGSKPGALRAVELELIGREGARGHRVREVGGKVVAKKHERDSELAF